MNRRRRRQSSVGSGRRAGGVSAGSLSTGILGLNFLGVDSFVQNLFYGGGLVIAVSISQLVRKRQAMD
jgi:ribose/xylose/arabinose/galactoside ABC-type transport system permease subunit